MVVAFFKCLIVLLTVLSTSASPSALFNVSSAPNSDDQPPANISHEKLHEKHIFLFSFFRIPHLYNRILSRKHRTDERGYDMNAVTTKKIYICNGVYCNDKCVEKSQLCDGVKDCPNGMDEHRCRDVAIDRLRELSRLWEIRPYIFFLFVIVIFSIVIVIAVCFDNIELSHSKYQNQDNFFKPKKPNSGERELDSKNPLLTKVPEILLPGKKDGSRLYQSFAQNGSQACSKDKPSLSV